MCARKYSICARKYGLLGRQTDEMRNDFISSYEVPGLHITAPILQEYCMLFHLVQLMCHNLYGAYDK